jgi:di/tricarboxylate transporter
MNRRTMLLSWLIFSSAIVIVVIGFGFSNQYQLLKLLQRPGVPVDIRQLLGHSPGGILVIAVLVTGVLLELCRFRWAWVINCSAYSLAFLSTAWSFMRHHGEHPEEELIAVVFVLIPSAVATVVTIFLYWFSRRRTESDLSPDSSVFGTTRMESRS